MPLKLRLFSVLLRMDTKRSILHIQKQTLLHSWTLHVTDGSTMHQDAWMPPFFTYLLYILYSILKLLNLSLSVSHTHARTHKCCNSPSWTRAYTWLCLHDNIQVHHTLVGLILTSDQPDAKTSTWQHTLAQDRHLCSRRYLNSQFLENILNSHLYTLP
jgi:hypothetical protein